MTKEITNFDMHADHGHWQSQLSMWQVDLQAWHSEHKKALAELEQIVGLIEKHEEATKQHGQALTALSDEIKKREHQLAERYQKTPGADASELADGHARHAKALEVVREAHERIKKHHHVAIARVFSLKASLEAAM